MYFIYCACHPSFYPAKMSLPDIRDALRAVDIAKRATPVVLDDIYWITIGCMSDMVSAIVFHSARTYIKDALFFRLKFLNFRIGLPICGPSLITCTPCLWYGSITFVFTTRALPLWTRTTFTPG